MKLVLPQLQPSLLIEDAQKVHAAPRVAHCWPGRRANGVMARHQVTCLGNSRLRSSPTQDQNTALASETSSASSLPPCLALWACEVPGRLKALADVSDPIRNGIQALKSMGWLQPRSISYV